MSALVTLNGLPVIEVKASLPRVGVWLADVSVDSAEALSGKVTLSLDGFDMVGTVRRGGVTSDVGNYRVVGGAAGFGQAAKPKAYNNTSARIIAQDLLGDAGEALSSSVDPSLLARLLPSWVTLAAPTGFQFAQLVQTLQAEAWRMAPDGTVWLGNETWPVESPDTLNVSAIDLRLNRFKVTLTDGAMVMPGTCYQVADNRVSYVKVASEGGRLEAEVWCE